jgi:hypothetical protein
VGRIRAFLNASEKVTERPVTPGASAPMGAPSVVLGGSEDTRLLLRGLLRLHRHRVLLEAPTREGMALVPVSPELKILVWDAGSDTSEEWAEELAAALRGRSDLRALVILPSADPAMETRARQAGAGATLVRPFAIRDFIEAVDSLGSPSAPA